MTIVVFAMTAEQRIMWVFDDNSGKIFAVSPGKKT